MQTGSLLRAEQCHTIKFPLHGRSNTLAESVGTSWHVTLKVHTEDQVSIVTLGVLVVHFSTAIFLVNRRSWGFAVISSASLAIGLVVIAGDWMMGGMVIVFLLAFQGNSRSE